MAEKEVKEFLKAHGIKKVDFDEMGYYIIFEDGSLHLWIDEDGNVNQDLILPAARVLRSRLS